MNIMKGTTGTGSEKMTYTGLFGTNYQLDLNRLASGGEGDIYRVPGGTAKSVAKIYHANKQPQSRALRY